MKNFVFLILAGFTFLNTQILAYSNDERAIVESMRKIICPKLRLEEEPFVKGFAYIGGLDRLTEPEIYAKGVELRKGNVTGLETETIERLFLQLICFKAVVTPRDDLLSRAMHNYGSTLLKLVQQLKTRMTDRDSDLNFFIFPRLYQEAWYLFSLANLEQSRNARDELVKCGMVAFVLNNPETKLMWQRHQSIVDTYISQETDNKGSNQKRPSPLEVEKELGQRNHDNQVLSFDDDNSSYLSHLYLQIIQLIKSTRKIELNEGVPLTVFIGRSTGFLTTIQHFFSTKIMSAFEFKHALVSGLATETPTHSQILGYKRYLDSLGFGELEKNRPLLITDAAETGDSLKKFGMLLKDLYGFTNIQYIAIMSARSTLNLERARVVYISTPLSKIMFAKHGAKGKYSLFPPFYHTEWEDYEEYLQSFQPQKEALGLKSQLETWLNNNQGSQKMAPILEEMASKEFQSLIPK